MIFYARRQYLPKIMLSPAAQYTQSFSFMKINRILFLYEVTRNLFLLWRRTQSLMKPHTTHQLKRTMRQQPPCEVRISVSCMTTTSVHITASFSSNQRKHNNHFANISCTKQHIYLISSCRQNKPWVAIQRGAYYNRKQEPNYLPNLHARSHITLANHIGGGGGMAGGVACLWAEGFAGR